MPKKRAHHKKTSEDIGFKDEWPGWFIEPTHPVEQEILFRLLRSDKYMSSIYFTVHMMQVNYIVFRNNYAELHRLQRTFDQPLNFNEIAMQTDRGKQIAQETILEFTRLLHNFLASAKMLVDVTRRWVGQQFANSEFLDKYQKEVSDRFANNVQAQFLGNLRNYTLHRALPVSIPELRMRQVSENTLKSSLAIVLLKDYLLEWEGWSELGKMQIDMVIEGEIDIMLICRQYFENVEGFTKWLFWQVRDLFNTEIDQVNSMIVGMRNPDK